MAVGLSILFLCLLVFVPLLAETEIQEFCPEYVVTTEQRLKTPSYPNFLPFVRCWYNISAPKDHVAVVSFENFDFPFPEVTGIANVQNTAYRDCQTDYVEIFTGNGAGTRFCGEELKNTKIFSETGKLEFIFQSLTRKGSGGFSASVQFMPLTSFYRAENFCGSLLEETDSRGYTIQGLSTDFRCMFTVKAPEGKFPEIKFFQRGANCLNFNAIEEYYRNTKASSEKTCDETWLGDWKYSYRRFGISISQGQKPVKIKVQVRYETLEDQCAKFLQKENNGFKIKYEYRPEQNNPFPSMCIWLIPVPQSQRDVSFSYNINMLEAVNGICTLDQLVLAEVFDEYQRNVYTPNPTCGKLSGESENLVNTNYPRRPSTMMVMAAFDNSVASSRNLEVAIRF